MQNDECMSKKPPTKCHQPPIPEAVFYFPVFGCEPARPWTRAEMAKQQEKVRKTIKKHWDSEGVKAIVELLQIEAAILQARACARGADQHDAGGGYHLLKVVRELQNRRWEA